MKLWIDADAAPVAVKEICCRASDRLQIETILVANQRLQLPKGVITIDPRGEEYTAATIRERLSVRNFMEGLRSTGVDTGGHAPFGPREKQRFANALDRALTRARKAAARNP